MKNYYSNLANGFEEGFQRLIFTWLPWQPAFFMEYKIIKKFASGKHKYHFGKILFKSGLWFWRNRFFKVFYM